MDKTAAHVRVTDAEAALPYDLRAGSVVFLVALPLCLGIALASGAPLLAGLVTGIVGGIVVSMVSLSPLSVSGPAAGLTLLVSAGIEDAGGYAPFLVAVILAGAFQLVLGFMRAGIIGYYFPTSVIKGLLAAIGAILILKQVPHAFGWDADFEGDLNFNQSDGKNTFEEIMFASEHVAPGAIIISGLGLAILILWPRISKGRKLEQLPAPLLVVLAGIGMNALFAAAAPQYTLLSEHLVQIPVIDSFAAYREQLPAPDWSALTNEDIWATAAVIAVIASLETLLCVEAIDKLDPYRRSTPASRELKAQGVGNMVAGLLGGIPMTAVIVRGSANVHSGGRTRRSAFFHGVLLLLAVGLIPTLLGLIPLAALAAILLFIGYKLAPISLFRRMWRLGATQFVPFAVTFSAILLTDLMRGTAIGMAAGIFYILREHVSAPYYLHDLDIHEEYGVPVVRIELAENVSFLNKAAVSEVLHGIENGSRVEVDASKSRHVDRDVLELIEDFRVSAHLRDIELILLDVPELRSGDTIVARTVDTR
jgi:MFS superfamily sulfate permease-like transporter